MVIVNDGDLAGLLAGRCPSVSENNVYALSVGLERVYR